MICDLPSGTHKRIAKSFYFTAFFNELSTEDRGLFIDVKVDTANRLMLNCIAVSVPDYGIKEYVDELIQRISDNDR